MTACLVLTCSVSLSAARISHSAPWGFLVQKELHQRWQKRSAISRRGRGKNILFGVSLGCGTFSGVSSLIWQDQKGAYVREIMEGKLRTPTGFSSSFFCEYRRSLMNFFGGISGEIGWSNVRTVFDQLYPKKRLGSRCTTF